MAIEYATKYANKVDEAFFLEALSEGFVNNDYDWTGVETVKVYSVPTSAMNDYKTTGTDRYGTPAELQNTAQELKVTKDRSFTFTIDKKSEDDTQSVMDAARALHRQTSEVVIPEVDEYRFKKLVSSCPTDNIKTEAVTKSNAYEAFLTAMTLLNESKVPKVGRVAAVSPAFLKLIKLDPSFTKTGDMGTQISINGQVGKIDNVPVVEVPSSYMGATVDFIISHPSVMPSPVKLNSYKIHSDPPGISGSLVEGRIRYDAFVLNNKKAAIAVHKHPTA